jgi:uncharacterized protein (DUF58 family)
MSIKPQNVFLKKMATLGRPGRLYIIPTIDGLKLLILNLILLIIGLIYANNYILLFNFILFCLFLGSMFYTHFNLQGLKLISAKINPLHVNEMGSLSIQFQTTSSLGHYFLKLKFDHDFINIDPTFSFTFEPNSLNMLKVDIPIKGLKRGVSTVHKLTIETHFPFHLFRSFCYFNPHLPVIVYPAKIDLNIHQSLKLDKIKENEGDDFILNNFKRGDSLKRVHWKKLAQTNRWYSKNIVAPKSSPLILSLNTNSSYNIEDQLSSICSALYQIHAQDTEYGLTLGDIHLGPNHSNQHLTVCLKALAGYEV